MAQYKTLAISLRFPASRSNADLIVGGINGMGSELKI